GRLRSPIIGKVVLQLRSLRPAAGRGYLAGAFPAGVTSVDGVPTPATIRVLYRPGEMAVGDGTLVAQVVSAPDGSWRVAGLHPSKRFDVVCRMTGFNDMILSAAAPVPY